MNKLSTIGIIGIILILTGASKVPNLLNINNQDNGLTIKYYLGMTFPKYNHPARLYDEIDLKKVDEIKKSKETISYYVGFYKNKKLIKFEKHLNDHKTLEFIYKYDEKGRLIEVDKKNFD